MWTTSAALRSTNALGFGCKPLLTKSSPAAPMEPPTSPGAGYTVLSAIELTLQLPSPRRANSVNCPSPPRQIPAPPESGRICRFLKTTGDKLSITSAGTPATPLGNPTALSPSFDGRAPVPPTWKMVNVKGGFWPRQTLSQIGSAPGAIKRPGKAPDNAA